MNRKKLLLIGFAAFTLPALATHVKVNMNATSATITLAEKETGATVETGEPTGQTYEFDAVPGKYILTAYAKNSNIENGKIELTVPESTETKEFTILTCTAYATNTSEGKAWTIEDEDYSLDITVNTREGETVNQEYGKSTTGGRYTFLAFSGNSYKVAFIPGTKRQDEGFMTLYLNGTLTGNIDVKGAIPQGNDFSITVPADAQLELGIKFTHFTNFTPIAPQSIEIAGEGKTFRYRLANGQKYNYRTWKEGGLTNAGYFTMSADESKCPEINFTEEDYTSHNPRAFNHDPKSNGGYEIGDMFLNINERGHLRLDPGQQFNLHGMRTWELTDNTVNNYFIEPDFHYTVLDIDFNPSDKVIEITNSSDNNTSAWSVVTAKGKGTAVVLATYDGINLNFYSNREKNDFTGGAYWGASWPENTGVFVVTVGEEEPTLQPNMTINEKYNQEAMKLAGKYVDAEHDVFYFLDTEEGFSYTFTPEGVETIAMASPEVSETGVTYAGFSNDGITRNADNSYTLLLKKGRNIVRLTDASGNSVYQVLTAKPCHREITNETRKGSKIFQPGDEIKIQYSGLFHPANKLAGIYNMSAYVTYNGTPNGSSLILGSGQYTFGSAPAAQAVTVKIPTDYDVVTSPVIEMTEGVIQVNGYGDPIGNHRTTSPTAGRSPNFTAVAHKTYFGSLPDMAIELLPVKMFEIKTVGAPEDAEVKISFNGKELSPEESGLYYGTYGTYLVTAKAEGYQCLRKKFEIGDEAEGIITFNIAMEELGEAWDGKTLTQPETNENGSYEIKTPAHLAWFAGNVNEKGLNQNAELLADLNLGNFDWTPIGKSSGIPFTGTFAGNGHTIKGLYIDVNTSNVGLFGYVKDGSISGIIVEGSVSGNQYVGGIAGYVTGKSTIDRCGNHADVTGSKTYVGGVAGYLYAATIVATNLYNTGTITGTTNCGGVIGGHNKDTRMENMFNVGQVEGSAVGGCVGATTAKNNLTNAFTTGEYQITAGQTTVSAEQMASGEIAYKLGDAFFQTIGIDPYPKFEGLKVYYDYVTDEYYNMITELTIDHAEVSLDINSNPSIVVKAIYDPEYVAQPELVWTSDDERVVVVVPADHRTATIKAAGTGTTTVKVAHAVCPEVFAVCHVTVTGTTALVESLTSEVGTETIDIFDISGKVIKLGATAEYCRTLAPGLYIIRYNGVMKQVLIR